jgi:predicted component of type VI protein secretion system
MRGIAVFGLVAAAAGTLSLPGCGSCVAKSDRIVVDVVSSADLNDMGSGPQHVRFQVWAVRDRQMFDGARTEALAEADGVATFERQGLGKAFVTDSSWIKPGSSRQLVLKVDEDEEFTHVGIAVLYPESKKVAGALDCTERPGYSVAKPDHKLTFSLGKQSIEAAAAEPAKK